MAIAYELALADWRVALVDRDRPAEQPSQRASWAAAGMLAPAAERLPEGPLLQLCRQSLAVYPDWINRLERLSGVGTGYWPCGILLPYESSTSQADAEPGEFQGLRDRERWNRQQLDDRQPGLGAGVLGATWLPEEGQVNNRQLVASLRAVLPEVGVTVITKTEVMDWVVEGDRLDAVVTSRGTLQADAVVAAMGSYTRERLDVPLRPVKGQMMRVFDPERRLQHVLYGDGIYIVPRQTGEVVIGATVEEVGFKAGNTAQGIQTLLNRAIALYPRIADLKIEETWWGFRPATPDLNPILGRGPQRNLYIATGHHRNGILLTPITAIAVAQLMCRECNQTYHRDAPLEVACDWSAFSWRRFAKTAVLA